MTGIYLFIYIPALVYTGFLSNFCVCYFTVVLMHAYQHYFRLSRNRMFFCEYAALWRNKECIMYVCITGKNAPPHHY